MSVRGFKCVVLLIYQVVLATFLSSMLQPDHVIYYRSLVDKHYCQQKLKCKTCSDT